MESFDVRFGRHLRALRKKHDLTQAQLAERSGLSTNAISSFERAVRFPDRDSMNALADALGIDPLLEAGFSIREPQLPPGELSPPESGPRLELNRLIAAQPDWVIQLATEVVRAVLRGLPTAG